MFRVLCSRSSHRRTSYQATKTAQLRGLGDLATFPRTVTQGLFGKGRGGRPGVSGYLLLLQIVAQQVRVSALPSIHMVLTWWIFESKKRVFQGYGAWMSKMKTW